MNEFEKNYLNSTTMSESDIINSNSLSDKREKNNKVNVKEVNEEEKSQNSKIFLKKNKK
jgi:hypothetical protein